MMRDETQMYQLLTGIAREDDRIFAVYMNGSRTNKNAPKDFFKIMILCMWWERQVLLQKTKTGFTNLERFSICNIQMKAQIIQMTENATMVG